MLKRILVVILAITMLLYVTGCTAKESFKSKVTNDISQEVSSNKDTDDLGGNSKGEDTKDTEESKDKEGTEEIKKEEVINYVEATVEKPALVGEWVEMSAYSTETKSNHPVYMRIVEIVRGEKAEKAVEEYNLTDSVLKYELSAENKEFSEWGYIDYEVYIPQSFPTSNYGVSPTVYSFTVRGLDGETLKSNGVVYIGLYSGDITLEKPNKQSGESYMCRAVFPIVKDVYEYLLETSTRAVDGSENMVKHYIKIQ